MAGEHYTVRINRRDGIVEICGPDKEWIAEQLDRLSVVFEARAVDRTDLADDLSDAPIVPNDVDDDVGFPAQSNGTSATMRRARRRRSGYRGSRNVELADRLTPGVQRRLVAFREARQANFGEAPDQAAIIAKFLKSELGWESLNADDLYTVFDVMGWRGPNPKNALQNARHRKGYFSSTGRDGRYALTHGGEQFAQHDAIGIAAGE